MRAFVVAVVLAIASITQAHAAEIKLLSTGLFRGALPVVLPAFERASGHKVSFIVATPGAIRDRLLKGELFDVVLLPTNLNVDDIAKGGLIAIDTRRDLGRTSLAAAIPAKAAKLDFSSLDAMKRAILAAKSIALTDPAGGAPIGRHVQQAADKFGFGAELRSRIKPIMGGGEAVAEAVAKGEADFGITLATEIVGVKGVEIGGFLPSEMQLVITGYGVLVTKSQVQSAGKALLEFLISAEGKRLMTESGIDPL